LTVNLLSEKKTTHMVYIRQKKQSRLKHFTAQLMGWAYFCAVYFYIFAGWLRLIK